jgi:hypothetical protein
MLMRRFVFTAAAVAATLGFCSSAAGMASDSFAGAVDLGPGYPSDFGQNFSLTSEAGEGTHAGNPPSHSGWLKWTPSTANGNTGPVTMQLCTLTSFDSVLAVYTGAAVNALTTVAENDDGCGTGSRLTFNALDGQTYFIVIDGKAGASGNYNLKLGPAPGNDAFPGASIGLAAPASGTTDGATGEPSEPDHAGKSGGNSVWYSFVAPSAGTVTAQTCIGSNAAFDSVLAVYQGASVDALTPIASADDECGQQSKVRFDVNAAETYRIAVSGERSVLDPGGSTGAFDLQLDPTPPNDDFGDAMTTATGAPAVAGTTVGATAQTGEPGHGGRSEASSSIWYSWTPSTSGEYTIDACDSDGDVALGVYTGAAVGALTDVAAADDNCGAGGTRASASVTATGGTQYSIAIDGNLAGTDTALEITPGDTAAPGAPQITGSSPSSPANDNEPEVTGTAEADSTVRLYGNAACTGAPLATGPAAMFAAPGLTVAVADNSTTSIAATATDAASNVSACSAPLDYVEQSTVVPPPPPPPDGGDATAPQTAIDSKPKAKLKTKKKSVKATFEFSANEAGARFECRLDNAQFAACTSPKSYKLKPGKHAFAVRAIDAAGNADATPATASVNVKRRKKK